MQEQQHNQTASGSVSTRKRRHALSCVVEIVQANNRNPGNPCSHLTPKERGERLAKLWAAMLRRV